MQECVRHRPNSALVIITRAKPNSRTKQGIPTKSSKQITHTQDQVVGIATSTRGLDKTLGLGEKD